MVNRYYADNDNNKKDRFKHGVMVYVPALFCHAINAPRTAANTSAVLMRQRLYRRCARSCEAGGSTVAPIRVAGRSYPIRPLYPLVEKFWDISASNEITHFCQFT
jgi:hypothetical protein